MITREQLLSKTTRRSFLKAASVVVLGVASNKDNSLNPAGQVERPQVRVVSNLPMLEVEPTDQEKTVFIDFLDDMQKSDNPEIRRVSELYSIWSDGPVKLVSIGPETMDRYIDVGYSMEAKNVQLIISQSALSDLAQNKLNRDDFEIYFQHAIYLFEKIVPYFNNPTENQIKAIDYWKYPDNNQQIWNSVWQSRGQYKGQDTTLKASWEGYQQTVRSPK